MGSEWILSSWPDGTYTLNLVDVYGEVESSIKEWDHYPAEEEIEVALAMAKVLR